MSVTKVPATGFLNVLVGDLLDNGALPTVTTDGNGVPVSSLLELQSTTRGFLLPRMTSAQVNAITTPLDGMMVYVSDVADLVVRKGGAWIQSAPPTGFTYTATTLTAPEVNGMSAAPFPVLPAAPAGTMYIVHSMVLQLDSNVAFANGGNIYLQYGNVAGTGQTTSNIGAAFLTGAVADRFIYAFNIGTSITNAVAANASITLSNDTAPFINGAGSELDVGVWYSIVNVT